MDIAKLNVRAGELFCVSYGEHEDARTHGPYKAAVDLEGAVLSSEFAAFLEAADKQAVAKLAGLADEPLVGGTYCSEPEGAAFVAWLVQSGRATPFACEVLSFETGSYVDGRKFVRVGGDETKYGEVEFPGPLGAYKG